MRPVPKVFLINGRQDRRHGYRPSSEPNWRRVDLKRVIKERFGVDYDTCYVGKLLHRLDFLHVSARPQHPVQDAHIVEEFKKLATYAEGAALRPAATHEGGVVVPG